MVAIDGIGKPVEFGLTRILMVPICALESPLKVLLSSTKQPWYVDVPTEGVGTGKMLQAVSTAFPGCARFLAGECWLSSKMQVWVVVLLAKISDCDLAGRHARCAPYSQEQLHGHVTLAPASLALAKVASMQSGCTSFDQLSLLFGQMVEGELRPTVGKVTPLEIAPGRLATERASLSRSDILRASREAESWITLVLETAAARANDPVLAQSLSVWAGQVTTTSLTDVPEGMLSQLPVFTDHRLASLPFHDKFLLPSTEAIVVPVLPQTATELPMSWAELLMPWAEAQRQEMIAEGKAYQELMWRGASERELVEHRPRPRYLGAEAARPQFRGVVWDCRDTPFRPLKMDGRNPSHIQVGYWNERMAAMGAVDLQLMQFVNDGVSTGVVPGLQSMMHPPLLSLGDGIAHVASEVDRLIAEGYLDEHLDMPFWPNRGPPTGCRPKRSTFRRIMDADQPRWHQVDSEGVQVVGDNTATKAALPLPREVKGQVQDGMNDECVLQYIAKLLGWQVVTVCDDWKDFFHQLTLHPSELYKGVFALLAADGSHYRWLVEKVMGLGYVHTSNLAQRFGNSIVMMFLLDFDELDAPFLVEECARLPVLNAWVAHRRGLKAHKHWNQARLCSATLFTDDTAIRVVVPKDGGRLVRALTAWNGLLLKLGLRTCSPEKKQLGFSVTWCGVLHLCMLGLVVIPEDKIQRTLLKLNVATSGHLAICDYESLVGMLGFVCFILKLNRSTMTALYEPLKLKGVSGPQSRVIPSRKLVNVWNKWAERLVTAHGAPITVALPSVEPIYSGKRTFVWYGDAAVKGTRFPGLCGYSHGVAWLFKLTARHLRLLQKYISALEFLVLIGNIMMYGASIPAGVLVLMQSDSLVSVRVLGRVEWRLKDNVKSPLMRYLLGVLQARPEYMRLKEQLVLGQVYGEGNNLADNGSRGDIDIMTNTCHQLGVKLRWLEVPEAFNQVIEATLHFAETLQDGAGLRAP
jgi:hypothetical protein